MNTKTLGIALLGIGIIITLASVSYYRASSRASTDPATTTDTAIACTREAKICPDGSAVGREGPNCEFAACPVAPVASGEYQTGDTETVSVRIGQTVSALGERITPTIVSEDSRCPTEVQCIWAGTVKGKAMVASGMGNGEVSFELGKESTTEVNSIILVSVTPSKRSTQSLSQSDYTLTFKVTRR